MRTRPMFLLAVVSGAVACHQLRFAWKVHTSTIQAVATPINVAYEDRGPSPKIDTPSTRFRCGNGNFAELKVVRCDGRRRDPIQDQETEQY